MQQISHKLKVRRQAASRYRLAALLLRRLPGRPPPGRSARPVRLLRGHLLCPPEMPWGPWGPGWASGRQARQGRAPTPAQVTHPRNSEPHLTCLLSSPALYPAPRGLNLPRKRDHSFTKVAASPVEVGGDIQGHPRCPPCARRLPPTGAQLASPLPASFSGPCPGAEAMSPLAKTHGPLRVSTSGLQTPQTQTQH